MEKVRLKVIGIEDSKLRTGAYTLVLSEEDGKRRLPIIIGGYEAQAILSEVENMLPPRPLTHDLFKNFALSFKIDITEVLIYNLKEGVFHSKLVCSDGNNTHAIEARTSDAIAMAVRFNCPIYTYEDILSQAGVNVDEETGFATPGPEPAARKRESKGGVTDLATLSENELQESLMRAIDEEAYELASKIRDELNKRKQA